MSVLIESHEEDGIEWGVSFTSSNPEPHEYVDCKTKEDAVRLHEYLEHLQECEKALFGLANKIEELIPALQDQTYFCAIHGKKWEDGNFAMELSDAISILENSILTTKVK